MPRFSRLYLPIAAGFQCEAGTEPADESGTFASVGAAQCRPCRSGSWGQGGARECELCAKGKHNVQAGSGHIDDCKECPAGKFTGKPGANICEDCRVDSFRPGADIRYTANFEAIQERYTFNLTSDDCLSCLYYPEHHCSETGMSFPGAHAGYFAFQANESLMPQFSVCNPFEACVATCPPDVLNEAPPDYRLCPHSFNNLSCTPGYGGDRCSECASLPEGTDLNTIECDSGVDTAEEEVAFAVAHSLGFYRMNGYCLPCPCTWVKTWHMVTVIVLVLVLFLMIVDYIAQRVNHISTIVSPQPSTLHPPPSSSSSSSSSAVAALLHCTHCRAARTALPLFLNHPRPSTDGTAHDIGQFFSNAGFAARLGISVAERAQENTRVPEHLQYRKRPKTPHVRALEFKFD